MNFMINKKPSPETDAIKVPAREVYKKIDDYDMFKDPPVISTVKGIITWAMFHDFSSERLVTISDVEEFINSEKIHEELEETIAIRDAAETEDPNLRQKYYDSLAIQYDEAFAKAQYENDLKNHIVRSKKKELRNADIQEVDFNVMNRNTFMDWAKLVIKNILLDELAPLYSPNKNDSSNNTVI